MKEPRVGNFETGRDALDVQDDIKAMCIPVWIGQAPEICNVCSEVGHTVGSIPNQFMRFVGVSVPVSDDLMRLSLLEMPAIIEDTTEILALAWRVEIALEETFRHRLGYGRQALG